MDVLKNELVEELADLMPRDICDFGLAKCVNNPENTKNVPREVCTVCWNFWLVTLDEKNKPSKKDNDMCMCKLGCVC